ncbi:hypothetical protein KUTeg_016833 [Tegillarca granosa]|uniref:Uncharacterized protein n=1 Tax=Tegillarca granosa TaxID=220873 RepID=A0ABQ9EM24_TEGGR|nr:hypothetical protein KUTeg_016833 [Tegillarca granosa]
MFRDTRCGFHKVAFIQIHVTESKTKVPKRYNVGQRYCTKDNLLTVYNVLYMINYVVVHLIVILRTEEAIDIRRRYYGLLERVKNYIKQGCVRLCFMSNNNEIIRGSFIRETVLSSRDGVFLSSLLFRDQFTAFCKSIDPKSVALGPCTLIQLAGFEIDDMLQQWPSSANEWINRVRKRNWPSRELVNDILKKRLPPCSIRKP